jgi:hypothetical protein
VEQEAREDEQKDADNLALEEEQDSEEEEEDPTDKLDLDEEQDLAEAVRRSEQDLLHKRKRDDEEDVWGAYADKGQGKKRIRTKEEEDAARATGKEELLQTQEEGWAGR